MCFYTKTQHSNSGALTISPDDTNIYPTALRVTLPLLCSWSSWVFSYSLKSALSWWKWAELSLAPLRAVKLQTFTIEWLTAPSQEMTQCRAGPNGEAGPEIIEKFAPYKSDMNGIYGCGTIGRDSFYMVANKEYCQSLSGLFLFIKSHLYSSMIIT